MLTVLLPLLFAMVFAVICGVLDRKIHFAEKGEKAIDSLRAGWIEDKMLGFVIQYGRLKEYRDDSRALPLAVLRRLARVLVLIALGLTSNWLVSFAVAAHEPVGIWKFAGVLFYVMALVSGISALWFCEKKSPYDIDLQMSKLDAMLRNLIVKLKSIDPFRGENMERWISKQL
jgi:hypothetical protein